MNKLTKAQRDRLIGIAIGVVAVIGALWYLVVNERETELARTERNTQSMHEKLNGAEAIARRADEIGQRYTNRLEMLQQREAGLAPDRDTYAWIINTINPFIQPRKGVNISYFSQPDFSDAGLMPRFPYRWATFHVKGVGYYQDFGKFFADFENSFPYFRIQNVDISGNPGPGFEPEKLAFSFDIVTPVVASADNK